MIEQEISIRSAVRQDLEKLLSLEREAFPDPWSMSSFASCKDNPFFEVEVAVCQDEVVGYGVLMHMYEQGEIAKIAVAKDYRRRYLGERLLEWLLAIAEHEGVTSVFLEVRESNKPARALYDKVGFEELHRKDGFYTNPPEAAITMRYDI